MEGGAAGLILEQEKLLLASTSLTSHGILAGGNQPGPSPPPLFREESRGKSPASCPLHWQELKE